MTCWERIRCLFSPKVMARGVSPFNSRTFRIEKPMTRPDSSTFSVTASFSVSRKYPFLWGTTPRDNLPLRHNTRSRFRFLPQALTLLDRVSVVGRNDKLIIRQDLSDNIQKLARNRCSWIVPMEQLDGPIRDRSHYPVGLARASEMRETEPAISGWAVSKLLSPFFFSRIEQL